MPRRIGFRAGGMALLAGLLLPSVGQPPGLEAQAPSPVALMLVGPGGDVLSRFGHAALLVRDRATGVDKAYNFGLSNIEERGFATRLLFGQVVSKAAIRNPDEMLRGYLAEGRTVEILELNLSAQEVAALQRHLEQAIEAYTVRGVPHDFFLMNCTIPIRDALDFALGGRLRRETETVVTTATYRSEAMPFVREDPLLTAVMTLGMGVVTDRPLTAWEEMFLPSALGERVRRLTIEDEFGDSVPMVRSTWIRYPGDGTLANPRPSSTPGWLLVGVVLGSALAASGSRRSATATRVALMPLTTCWLAANGLAGVCLFWLALVANQPASDWNQNLLLANPISLVMLERIWALRLGDTASAGHVRAFACTLLAGTAAAVWLQSVPAVAQDNGPVLAVAVPAHLGLAWGVGRVKAGELRLSRP